KGPLMKAAQLLATIPDALPPEYARELAQLQANAPAMGWAFVRRRMASELGPDWQSKFARFDKEASFAASLGQVHRATLLDGREAKHAALDHPMLRDEPQVQVPSVIASHSTERLLTMDWLHGAPLLDWKTRSQEERDSLAIAMFRAWYVPFYFYGTIHGDPH